MSIFIYFLWKLMFENCRLILIVTIKYGQMKYYLEMNLIMFGWLEKLSNEDIWFG